MLIDTHCHLSHKKFKKADSEIVKEAQDSGVEKIITVGTNIKDSETAVKNAQKFGDVFASVGVYPHEEQSSSIKELQSLLESLLKNDKIVAVGECGIDVVGRSYERKVESQSSLFEMQIKLSQKYNLPLIIHNRNGEKQVLELLAKHKAFGVMHSFTQNWEFAQKMLDLGFYLSFSGIVTYKNTEALLKVVERAPIDKILVETDAPYLSPQPVREEINEPKYVRMTAQKIADIRGISYSKLCEHTYENSCRLFKFNKKEL